MADYTQLAADVVKAVGGKENIIDVTNCMTRLRFVLKDDTVPNNDAGARLCAGHHRSSELAGHWPVMNLVSNALSTGMSAIFNFNSVIGGALFGAFWQLMVVLGLHAAMIPILMSNLLTQGSDPINGVGIDPSEGLVVAPFDGEITSVVDSKHAVGITSKDGMELLIHVGVDTVKMNGKGFHTLVSEGDMVKAGDELIRFDIDEIKKAGFSPITAVLVTNSDDYDALQVKETSGNRLEELISIR